MDKVIRQHGRVKIDSENLYDNLFNVRLNEITLRELLILLSLYITETESIKYKLIEM